MSRRKGVEPPVPKYGLPRSRPLTAEEERLWKEVMVDTIPKAGRRRWVSKKTLPSMVSTADHIETGTKQSKPAATKLPPAVLPRSQTPQPPPLNRLDDRTAKRLVRGQLMPEARLDLHGKNRHTAPKTLLRFVADARASGKRLVLVITGKGSVGHMLHGRDFHANPDGRSILRELVPGLLSDPEYRTHVAGFQPAHPKHGGGGALYLWLRRPR